MSVVSLDRYRSTRLARQAILGALAGVTGAAAMNVLRHAARRAGLVDKGAHQVAEEWAAWRSGVLPPGGSTGHHVADQLLHLGIGAAWGALYRAAAGRRSASLAHGAGFGMLLWLLDFGVIAPVLGMHRPPWRASAAENGVNALAHGAFGAVVALVAEETSRQRQHRAGPRVQRQLSRAG